jgi:predicted PurR-regulated permease PerM
MFNRTWNNPLLTLVLLLLMADAFGRAGVILALPLSVAYQIMWSHLVRRPIGSWIADHIGVH